MYIACQKGYTNIARLLLDAGANADAACSSGSTPLYIAAQKGYKSVRIIHSPLFSYLLRWLTPLWSTFVFFHRPQVVHLLLQRGASIESLFKNNWTPLSIASSNGHHEIVDLLLQYGARTDVCDYSPLYKACQKGHVRVVKTLVKYGADIQACGKDGSTPLYIAAQEGHTDIVEFLLRRKASVDVRWSSGYTPLYISAQKGHKAIVTLLIEHGADIEAASDVGSTPLYIAAQKGNSEVVEDLIRFVWLRILCC